MAEELTFTTLGEDVLHIVISLLHSVSPRSLRRLSLASKFCKELVDPSLYRSIALSNNEKSLAFTERVKHRLLDPGDGLSHHVRELNILGLGEESERFGVADLESILGGLFRLQTFNWAVNADLPERVISQLEKQWPSVKLIVSEYDRMGTDTRILSSPLLHELTFGINNWKSGYEVQEQYSRLPKLREVLLESPQLKKLDIRTQYSWLQRGIWPGHTTTFETRPRLLNLPLQPSDRLPSLDELRFSGRDIYELDLEHCQLLKQCMNWSQLRTLDLGLSCPQHFFEEIGDKLVSLKSLGMGITTGDRKYLYWKYGPMTCNYNHYEPVRQFLRCVSGLYELRITDLATAARLIVADLLDSQESLRTLSFHSSMRRRYRQKHKPHAWKMTQLDELRHRAPDLEDLEIDFPLEEIEIPLEDGKWPSHFASTMARFNNLRRLKIFVELNEAASDFAGEYRQDAQGSVPTPPFNEKLGREVTTSLFRSFFENDAYARLTELEVSFTHVKVYDRGQHEDIEFPIKVRRLERDDAPSPLDGGFTVECQGKWLRGR